MHSEMVSLFANPLGSNPRHQIKSSKEYVPSMRILTPAVEDCLLFSALRTISALSSVNSKSVTRSLLQPQSNAYYNSSLSCHVSLPILLAYLAVSSHQHHRKQ